MFGEDNQFALPPVGIPHLGRVLKQLGEFVPFAVLPGVDNFPGLFLKVFEAENLGFQFLNGLGRRSLIDNRLFKILVSFGVERFSRFPNVLRYAVQVEGFGNRLAPLTELFFINPPFELGSTALERLVDGFRAGGKTALQGGQGKSHRSLPCPVL